MGASTDAKIKLDVSASGDAAKKFTDTAKAASEAEKAIKKAEAAQKKYDLQVRRAEKAQRDFSTIGERDQKAKKQSRRDERKAQEASEKAVDRNTKYGNAFNSGGVMGLLSAAGGKFALLGTIATMTGKAIDGVATSLEILNDSYATGAQQTRALVSEFVPFGDKIIRLGDAMDGTTDAMHRNQEAHEMAAARASYLADMTAKHTSASLEQTGAQARSSAFGKFGLSEFKKFDTSTLGGERGAAMQDTRLGAADESVRAQRELFAAKAEAKAAQERANYLDESVYRKGEIVNRSAQKTADARKAETSGNRDKSGVQQAALQEQRDREALSRAIKDSEEATRIAKEKGAAAVQAEASARAAAVNQSKAELAILQQQEQRMVGMARAYGAMSKGERLQSIRALQMVRQRGVDNVPVEIANQAAKIAGDYIGKQREKSGAAGIPNDLKAAGFGDKDLNEIFDRGDGKGDFTKGNSLKDVKDAIVKAKADIRVTVDLDASAMAKQMADLMSPILANFIQAITIEMQNIEGKIRIKEIIKKNEVN